MGTFTGQEISERFCVKKIRDTQTLLFWLRFQRLCSARHRAKLATIVLETESVSTRTHCDPAKTTKLVSSPKNSKVRTEMLRIALK